MAQDFSAMEKYSEKNQKITGTDNQKQFYVLCSHDGTEFV